MDPAWWKKRGVKKKSRRLERRAARDLGGRAQPASGALSFAKGDIRLADYLIEHKFTENASYSISLETINKIEREARAALKLPAMVIEIQGRRLFVMRFEDVATNKSG